MGSGPRLEDYKADVLVLANRLRLALLAVGESQRAQDVHEMASLLEAAEVRAAIELWKPLSGMRIEHCGDEPGAEIDALVFLVSQALDNVQSCLRGHWEERVDVSDEAVQGCARYQLVVNRRPRKRPRGRTDLGAMLRRTIIVVMGIAAITTGVSMFRGNLPIRGNLFRYFICLLMLASGASLLGVGVFARESIVNRMFWKICR